MTVTARSAPPNLLDYEAARASFQLEVPQRFNPVIDIVESWAASDPDAIALVSINGDGSLGSECTTRQLVADAHAAARAFLSAGIGKGDRVLIMLPRVPQWYAAVLGAIRIGAVPMPAPNLMTGKDLAYRAAAAGAVALVTDELGAVKVDSVDLPSVHTRWCWGPAGAPWRDWGADVERFADASPEARDRPELPADPTASSDPMLVYFTSGTVSLPKMVLHTQEYGLGHVTTARFWQDLRAGDRHWTVSDTGWAKAAWGGLFGQFHERATVVQVALGKPDTETVLRILAEHRVTSFCAPPTLYRQLVQGDLTAFDLTGLRHCTSAGEPLNPEIIRAWSTGTGGLTVYDGYGQTETVNCVANFPGMPVKPGSMGRPTPGWTVEIRDDDGNPVEVGTVGNIVVSTNPRPIGLFHGYYRDAAATAKVMRGDWYFTGDKAALDDAGYFWFEGRSDDVITSSAYRIGPFEVESALVEHPAVQESAVVGKADVERTELVTAFVILAPGYQASPELALELQNHVKQATAPYKYPRLVIFVEELPKTISGKIRRAELKARVNAGEWG